MVINCNLGGYVVHDVLVHNGSAADILMAKAFRQMEHEHLKLEPPTNPLCGFGGSKVEALGKVMLHVSFGDRDNARTECITFDIVDVDYPYNAILGRGRSTHLKQFCTLSRNENARIQQSNLSIRRPRRCQKGRRKLVPWQ